MPKRGPGIPKNCLYGSADGLVILLVVLLVLLLVVFLVLVVLLIALVVLLIILLVHEYSPLKLKYFGWPVWVTRCYYDQKNRRYAKISCRIIKNLVK